MIHLKHVYSEIGINNSHRRIMKTIFLGITIIGHAIWLIIVSAGNDKLYYVYVISIMVYNGEMHVPIYLINHFFGRLAVIIY